MVHHAARHYHRSVRLKWYDYSQAGAYFVTICACRGTACRARLFGHIKDGQMVLNDAGWVVVQCWQTIPDHFPHVELDVFVIMPNHLHGIIVLHDNVWARHAVPLQAVSKQLEHFRKPVPGSIPTIIRSFKSAVTKRINEMRRMPGVPVWQRNYYEHAIRNDGELNRIREYVVNNPAQWEIDRENPAMVNGGAKNFPPQPFDEPWRI